MWSRLNGIQKYIHVPAPEISYDLHQNAFCTFWVPVQSLRAVRFQDFIKKLFIPILIWQTIRIRSNVQLHQVLFFLGFFYVFFFWTEWKVLELEFVSTVQVKHGNWNTKAKKFMTPQNMNAIVWSLVHYFIKTRRRSVRQNELRKVLQRGKILSKMILVFKLS